MPEWNFWDRLGVADHIRGIWTFSMEIAHRKDLAQISAGFIRRGDALLEVGCGSGLMYGALSELVEMSYTGIDISREMLKAARMAHPGVTFEEGDGYSLRFPNASFDVTAAYDVFQHLPDIAGFVRELVRVARRMILFTILEGKKTKMGQEEVLGHSFLLNRYSRSDAESLVRKGSGGLLAKAVPVFYGESNLWAVFK